MRKSLPLLGAVLALVVPAAASAATVGINVSLTSQVPIAPQTGASYGRSFVFYAGGALPDAGTLATTDEIVNGYVNTGIKPVLTVSGKGAPPADPAAYASFIGALAQRYAGKVAAWEIWNEEDEAIWWGRSGGDPGAYANLLRAAYPGVHPYAPVFVGGLTGNNYKFVDQLYGALGGSSAGAFDGVATHTDTACSIVGPDSFYRNPDGRISEFSFLGLREVHQSMVDHGDGDKLLWITELGWNTSSGVCNSGVFAGKKAAGVSEANQALFLQMAWHCLKDYPYVSNALLFNLQDQGDDSPINRYGLLRTDGSQKASWQAFKEIAAGKDPLAGQPCGDFDPPVVTVAQPTEGGMFFDVLPIDVTAADPGGVGRISLAADGKTIRNFTTGKTNPAEFPKTLNGAITWQGSKQLAMGPHTITVTALDGSGNTTTKQIHVTKVSLSSVRNLPTKFQPLKLSGKGARRSLRVQVTAPSSGTIGFRAVHKVKVTFQKKVKGKWKTAHKYTKTAKKPFTLRVKLEKAQWRVQAVFVAKPPYRGSKTPWLKFKV